MEKKEKFDPKTLKPFDRVIIRGAYVLNWFCELFSYSYIDFKGEIKFFVVAVLIFIVFLTTMKLSIL